MGTLDTIITVDFSRDEAELIRKIIRGGMAQAEAEGHTNEEHYERLESIEMTLTDKLGD